MRGKKADSEFLSEFISKCIRSGMETPAEIASHARDLIQEIDEEIKRVEKRKVIRSKLLDVVSAFDKPTKSHKADEIRALAFFKIQKPVVCKYICDTLKKSPAGVEGFTNHPVEDIMFGLKQLLEAKVISRSSNVFLRGEMFDEYLKFVLREGQ